MKMQFTQINTQGSTDKGESPDRLFKFVPLDLSIGPTQRATLESVLGSTSPSTQKLILDLLKQGKL